MDAEQAPEMESSLVVQILVSLNLTGRGKSQAFKLYGKQAKAAKHELSEEQKNILIEAGV